MLIPNPNQVKIWNTQYELIQTHFYPHRPSFSVNDYKLAYLGTETCTIIISNDHHLQNQLHQYLDFECILPGQVTRYPNFEMFLIDANLLIPMLISDHNAKMMAKMFINAKDKTFLIPNFILEEVLKYASGRPIKKATTVSNEGQKWLISNRYRFIFEENYN